ANLGAGLIDGDTRTKPADHRHIVAGPITFYIAWIIVQRDPNLRFCGRKTEICRQYSNYFAADTFKLNDASNHRRVAGEALLPQRMAQDHVVVSSGYVFAGTEQAAQFRSHAQNRKQLSRYLSAI